VDLKGERLLAIGHAVNDSASCSPREGLTPRSGKRGENRIRSKRRTARRLVVETQPQKGRPQAWISDVERVLAKATRFERLRERGC